jgi:hypothetical protein
LDPDLAATDAPPEKTGDGSAPDGLARSTLEPVIDTRPYKLAIAGFGLVLVLALSVYQFLKNGVGSPGVTAGQPLHYFVAPLATGDLNGDVTTRPRCNPSQAKPQALNICPWLLARAPLVLALFVTASDDCKRQVDAMQSLSRRFSPRAVQFAAVAVKTGRSDAAAVVRSHRWTIPVAYDRDGALGELYGVSICPLVELVSRSGIVKERLIGSRYATASALGPKVQALSAGT